MIDLFISFEGRISRMPFWLAVVGLTALELAASAGLGDRPGTAVGLILAYPEFAVFAKRGHDRNVPTWVPGLFIAGGIVLDLLILLDVIGPVERPSTLFYLVALPVGLFGLILLIDFGFRRGRVGPNRFGPDPLAKS